MAIRFVKGDDESPTLLNFFGRHLVLLTGAYVELDEAGLPKAGTKVRGYNFTGWVCELFGRVHIVTAGHAVSDFFKALDRAQIRVESGWLADSFGIGAEYREPVPFNLVDQSHIFCDNEDAGLDFAIIQPSRIHEALMLKNNVVPFTERQWSPPANLSWVRFVLLGFPEALTQYNDIPVESMDSMSDRPVSLARLAIVPLRLANSELAFVRDKTFPRFAGEIDPECPLERVKGMSGGPIIAASDYQDGQFQYFVVAIQSTQVVNSRRIFGCHVKTVMDLVQREVERRYGPRAT